MKIKKNNYDYSSKDVSFALESLGIRKGDNLFCHSNTFFLGRPFGDVTKQNIYKTIIKGFFDIIGNSGTLFFPAYTYSFPRKETFHLGLINKENGILSEMCIRDIKSYRSLDPNVSVVGLGKYCRNFLENLPNNSYAENSFFDNFFRGKGKVCNININSISTFIHYFERRNKVNYRFDKTFTGKLKIQNKTIVLKSTIYVRKKRSIKFKQSLDCFDYLCKKKKIYVTANVGKGYIGSLSLKDMEKLIKNEINKNHYFLTELGKEES